MIAYYLGGKRGKITLQDVQSIGLGYAFDSDPVCREVVANGPDSGTGVVIGRDGVGLGYYPDKQTWEAHAKCKGVWIGYSEQVNPAQLIRPRWKGEPLCIPSALLVTDRAGWQIPVARAWSIDDQLKVWNSTLPHKIAHDGEKFVIGDVQAKFSRLEEIGSMVIDGYAEAIPRLPENYINLCAELMSMVYYISEAEFGSLEIVNTDPMSCWSLLRLVADIPGLEALQKKSNATSQQNFTTGLAG